MFGSTFPLRDQMKQVNSIKKVWGKVLFFKWKHNCFLLKLVPLLNKFVRFGDIHLPTFSSLQSLSGPRVGASRQQLQGRKSRIHRLAAYRDTADCGKGAVNCDLALIYSYFPSKVPLYSACSMWRTTWWAVVGGCARSLLFAPHLLND